MISGGEKMKMPYKSICDKGQGVGSLQKSEEVLEASKRLKDLSAPTKVYLLVLINHPGHDDESIHSIYGAYLDKETAQTDFDIIKYKTWRHPKILEVEVQND
jgi:hypothetical protein